MEHKNLMHPFTLFAVNSMYPHPTPVVPATVDTRVTIMVAVAKKLVGGGGINWEDGMNTYLLLHIKYRSNKGLLYSTGNDTQYSINNPNGKREWIYA